MSHIKKYYDFMTGVNHNGELFYNRYRLMIDFYKNTDVVQDLIIGLERINNFLSEIVERSVFMKDSNTEFIEKYHEANIPVLTVPGPGPLDPVILHVLVTKMNAILEESLIITSAELTSYYGGEIVYIWNDEDEDDELHEIINLDNEALWWASPSPRYISYDPEVDVEEIESENPWPIDWEMFNLGWYDESENDDESEIVFTVDQELNKKLNDDDSIIDVDFTKK